VKIIREGRVKIIEKKSAKIESVKVVAEKAVYQLK
jgi:hypothetical protein